MAGKEITLIVEEKYGARPLLSNVIDQLESLARLLKALSETDTTLEVVSITKHSPLNATLRTMYRRSSQQGRTRTYTYSPAKQPANRLRATLDALNHGKRLPGYADAYFLSELRDFAEDLRKHKCTATVISDEERFRIDSSLIGQIDNVLGRETIAYTTVTGILEGLNVHGSRWTFTIFPSVGASRVLCRFDREDLTQIRVLVKDTVEVFGPAIYKGASPWPYKMRAERFRRVDKAPAGIWADMPSALRAHWEGASEDEREDIRLGAGIA